MTTEETARALFAALAAQDGERAATLFAPYALNSFYALRRDAPVSGHLEGPASIRAALAAVRKVWSVERMILDEIVVDGIRAAMHVTIEAVDRRSGNPVRTEAVHFLTVSDGLITELDVYCGGIPVAARDGSAPTPVPPPLASQAA